MSNNVKKMVSEVIFQSRTEVLLNKSAVLLFKELSNDSDIYSVSIQPNLLNSTFFNAGNDNDSFPSDLTFNENSLSIVIVYCVLFVVAAIGNLTVFITLFKSRHRKSRISLMIAHLAIADLLVTFFMIPLEVGWRLTVQWKAGNLACKIFLLLRAFGLYLSSNILVCVSLDRYFAILHPLRVSDARRRGKLMLGCAWFVSLVWSLPQSIVFHVSPHPKYPTFYQCVSFGFFSSPKQEMVYNLFCVFAMYFIPLMVIIVSYTAIMCEISHKSRENNGASTQSTSGRMTLRRSDMSNIERARSRTLKMTVTIVFVFIWCWTPYVIMTLWYMFDRDSAAKVANWVQDGLFMMAVSNSCMNPVVYGSYAINFRKDCCQCFSCFFRQRRKPSTFTPSSKDNNLRTGRSEIRRRVIKCVYSLRKVGSGGSATTLFCGITKSPVNTPQILRQKNPNIIVTRRSSIGNISIYSEPNEKVEYQHSFHSDPTDHSPYKIISNNDLCRQPSQCTNLF